MVVVLTGATRRTSRLIENSPSNERLSLNMRLWLSKAGHKCAVLYLQLVSLNGNCYAGAA